jgi:predicted RNase H-like HicB family nuclease
MKQHEQVQAIDRQYVCTFRPEPEGGYTVRCAAFPEIVSYAPDLAEARQNAREALELCVSVYLEQGRALPPSDQESGETIKELVPVSLAGA